jgi:serpin B
MTTAGARGATLEQMAGVLHFPFAPDRVHAANAALIQGLLMPPGAGQAYRLQVANALWGQQGYHFLETFQQRLRDHYGAALHEVDFRGAVEEARRTINTWVEEQTQDKIRDLIPSGALDASTRLVLTNAIYFLGTWASPFDKATTKDEDFHLGPARKVAVPMMHQTKRFPYFDGGTFQALELPYTGQELALVVFLPKSADGLTAFEAGLSAKELDPWLSHLRPREVVVTLPRFKLTEQFELSRVLAALGMPLAFSDDADFSAMNGGRDPLKISAVLHKAFVDVNEVGTEAAAATGIVVALAAAIVRPEPPIVFRADHPFVFLIRDRRTGSLLFLGRLMQPQG